jgi:hypothetical protein
VNQATRIKAAYVLLFLVAAWGCLWNLDSRRIWGDEAETALLAVNITQFGVPRTQDGRNEITNLPDRQDANEDGIWTWSPWLDEYITATSFLVLGPTTTAARLPFAILGLLSVVLLGRVAFRTYQSHSVALVAMTLYVTCVPFLLHARQARYYALALLAQIWLLHGVARSVREPGLRATLHVAIPLAILFYSNYVLVLAPALAIAAFGLFQRHKSPETFRCLALAGVLLLAAALPWLLYAGPTNQIAAIGVSPAAQNAFYFVSELHHHVVPWVILALPLFALGIHSFRKKRPPKAPSDEARAIEFFAWSVLALSLLVYALSPFRFFRYLVPLIPAALLLCGAYLSRYLPSPWLRGAVVAVLVFSNALSFWTALPFGGPLPHALGQPYLDFGRSITSGYEDRAGGIVDFLNGQAQPGDTLWVPDPEFPVIFYTGLSVLDARIHKTLPAEPPDWVLPFSASGISQRMRLHVPPAWAPLYDEIELNVPRSKAGGSRPDPHARELFTDPRMKTVKIYRLIK